MNRRQEINKILHKHIDVNVNEDYTNYKKLISDIEDWHDNELKSHIIISPADFESLEDWCYNNASLHTEHDLHEILNRIKK